MTNIPPSAERLAELKHQNTMPVPATAALQAPRVTGILHTVPLAFPTSQTH
ncbi:MAG: hypothetical protein P1U50_03170 [Parvibaculaceae bacterium]|nr:hypothetical protein [Parvibaculaceae bacterium]